MFHLLSLVAITSWCSFLYSFLAVRTGTLCIQLQRSREDHPHCSTEKVSGHMGSDQAALASADWITDGRCR